MLNSPLLTVTFLRILSTAGCVFAKYNFLCLEAELRKRINDRVNRNEYKSNLIEELIDIGFTNIWTTNFDNAVEHNFLQQNILINKVFKDSDFSHSSTVGGRVPKYVK